MNRKGIILAGGTGSRLFPLTYTLPKSLLPLYDVPMISFPLAIMLACKIKEVAIITTSSQCDIFQKTISHLLVHELGDQWDQILNINWFTQDTPKGIADAFLITKEWLAEDKVLLVLGDNVFLNPSFYYSLKEQINKHDNVIYGVKVADPYRYGTFTPDLSYIIEKPAKSQPISGYVVPGIYAYDSTVCSKAENLSPSPRGELEITDINNLYLQQNLMHVCISDTDSDIQWYDSGTHDALIETQMSIYSMVKRLGSHPGRLKQWLKF